MEQNKMKGDKGSALVIGAGISGMQSALLLAEMGRKVFLLEQGPAIGGYFPLLDKTFPTNSCGVCFMSPTPPAFCPIYECHLHDNIELLPYSEVSRIEGGGGGDFKASIVKKPRFVDPNRCTLCEACIKVCPVEVEREFGGGLEKRKAIYLPYPQAIPHSLVIDPKTCTRCGECVKVCAPGAIDLNMKEEQETIQAGAIVLGFGFEPFWAQRKGEYGFGRYENVLTSIQFERLLSTSSPSQGLPIRLFDGKKMAKIAFLQCVGSRDPSCGQDQCSTICCMYAMKQAMIAKDRSPDLGITFFYMDIRPMGKDYERYYEKAKSDYDIEFKRCAVSSVKELQQTKNLTITYVTEDGKFEEKEFDAVILSVGFTPPQAIKDLAKRIGLQLNPQGFCQTEEFNPAQTSVKGIFVGGAFRSPRDIPESVVEGSSAAAMVASFLSPEGLQPKREYPAEGALNEEIPKVGVFLCHCGDALRKRLSISELANETKKLREVVHVEEVGLPCLPDDMDVIKRRIGEQGLNRIVIAGCSQREIRKTMEEMAKGIGFNPHLIEYANIREQCAFVHEDHPESATEKALVLIRMAVERARKIQPIRKEKRKVEKKGLVVGGGLSGMTASLRLAEQGFEVHLIEKEKGLGGNLKESLYTLKGSNPQTLLQDLVQKVKNHGSIHLYTEAEILGFEKKNGHYRTKIRHENEEKFLSHGALILATGGREVTPKGYLYAENDRVMTQRQLEKLIHQKDEGLKDIRSVVMIQCVGSRDEEHPYCSRVCCNHAVKNALKLKEINPRMNIYVLYRDVRTYGFYETYYHEARGKGVIFIRYDPDHRPEVVSENGKLQVSVYDPAMVGRVNLLADRVVLSTGIEPNEHQDLAKIFDVDLNPDGFFLEANPKSAPLDSVDRGKFFIGLCHSPNFIEDVISQANGAAARAAALLSQEVIEEKATLAYVIKRLCCGCGLCVSVCPYQARVLNEEEWKAEVMTDLCQGCGSCVIACRNGASQQKNFEKNLNMAVLDVAID